MRRFNSSVNGCGPLGAVNTTNFIIVPAVNHKCLLGVMLGSCDFVKLT